MKKVVCLLLLLITSESFAACEDLKNQVKNFETACDFTREITAGCGAFTPLATALFGPVGMACSIPSALSSGVCALKELKKRWYEECRANEGRVHSWKRPTNTRNASNQYAALVRDQKMDENNKDFQIKVDAFIEELRVHDIDIADEMYQDVIKSEITHFEDEYIERRKEIDREFKESSTK